MKSRVDGHNESSTIATVGCNIGVVDYSVSSGQTLFGAGCGESNGQSASGIYVMKLDPGRAEQQSRRVTDRQGYVRWSPDGTGFLVSGERERPMTLFDASGREIGQRERLVSPLWLRSDATIKLAEAVEPELVIE